MENLSLYDAGYEDGYKKGFNDALNFMMDLAEKEENDPDIELGFNYRQIVTGKLKFSISKQSPYD